MSLRVVGAGVGRTGTTSLKLALEQLLGGRCHHMMEVFASPAQREGWTRAFAGDPVDWSALMAEFTSAVDWPAAASWRELMTENPESLVLLSVRDPEGWYRSASNTILPSIRTASEGGDPWMSTMFQMLGQRFSDRFDDQDAMIDAYLRHNDAVRAEVPPERLLEWMPGDGWDPICERLGLAVPDEPFPVTNRTDDFRAMTGLPPLDS